MPDAIQVQARPPIKWGPVRFAPLLFIAISNILKQPHPLLIPVLNNGMQQSDTLIETQAFMAAAVVVQGFWF